MLWIICQKWQICARCCGRAHGKCTHQDEDSNAVDMAEVADVVAEVADALTRMKTAMLLA